MTDFILNDTTGQPAKYCEIHGTLAGSANTSHDQCGTREIRFSEFWELMSLDAA